MKKLFVPVLTIILVMSLFGSLHAQKFTQQRHENSKWYFYLMAAGLHHIPPEEYLYDAGYTSATRFAPVLGIGWQAVSPIHGFGLNVEFDYTFANFNDNIIKDKSVSLFTLSGAVEFKFDRRSRWSGFASVGVALQTVSSYSFLDYYNEFASLPSETIVPIALGFGLKYNFNRHISLRAEFRAYREIYGYEEDDYYYDYYIDDYIDDGHLEGYWRDTVISIGLEYHFR